MSYRPWPNWSARPSRGPNTFKSLADANRIIQNSPTILFRLAPQPPFPLIYLSRNIDHYGYDVDALLAEPEAWLQLIHAEDMPAIIGEIEALLSGERELANIEFRLKKADGAIAWFNGHGRMMRDAEGRLAAVEGILPILPSASGPKRSRPFPASC